MIQKFKRMVDTFLKNRIQTEVTNQLDKFLPILPQLIDFYNSSPKERQSFYDHTKTPTQNIAYYENLKNQFIELGIPVEERNIDIDDFKKWLDEFSKLKIFYSQAGDVFIEKCLEHYLSYIVLDIAKNDVYIDIAAAGSPWAEILKEKNSELITYRLDLSYPPGIHGINIGANAGKTFLPDGFASVLSAQCAYECFMGESDIQFLKEARRILMDGGRFGIIPLYIDDTYYIASSPYCDQRDILFDSGAKKIWRDDNYREPFSRHYSPMSFKSRIWTAIPEGIEAKIIFFKNLNEITECFPGQRIYCYFMFYCKI